MKPSKHRLVRRLFALAVFAFLIVAAFGPMLFVHLGSELRRAAYAEAGDRHTVKITSAVRLFERPLVIADRADISLVLPNARALDDQEIAKRLSSGNAELLITDAKLTLDTTGLHEARIASVSDAVQAILAPLRDGLFARIDVRDAKLMLNTAKGGSSVLGRLSCEAVKSSTDEISVTGTLERDGISLPFEVSLNTKSASKAPGRLAVTVKSASDLLTAAMTGELLRADEFTFNASTATISAPSAKALIGWMNGASLSGNGLDDLRISGPLEWHGGKIAFHTAKVSIDGNEATGGLSVTLGNGKPMLDGTLAFENLELAPYFPSRSSAIADLTQGVWNWKHWLVGDPSAGSLIRHVDADLRLSANSVTSQGILLGRGAASIAVRDDKLLADLAEIELDDQAEGNARITVDLSSVEPRYAVSGTLNSTDLASVTRVFSDREIVSGAGRLDVDLKSVGNTDDEIRSSLTGSAMLAMPDGGQVAVDLGSLLAAGKTGGLGWEGVATSNTSLDKLSANFQANNGVLIAKDVQAETSTRQVEVAGTIDLTASMLDLSIAAAPKPGTTIAQERLRIRGPLLAPVIKSEPMTNKAALSGPSLE